jgi:hypothetical protein
MPVPDGSSLGGFQEWRVNGRWSERVRQVHKPGLLGTMSVGVVDGGDGEPS